MSKIAIVGPAHPYRGGIAAFSERLAKEFQMQGHEVVLCTFTLQYPSFLFPGETQYSTSPAPEGIEIVRMVNSMNPLNWVKTGRRLRKMRADYMIFAFWLPYMAPAFGTVARVAGSGSGRNTKMVGLLHNLVPHEKRPGDTLLARYFCSAMDSFVMMSEAVRETVMHFSPGKKCSFSPHPLYDNFGAAVPRDEACGRLGLDANLRYLLFFGLIRDYKGLDWLLEAFADKRLAEHGELRLIIAGEFYGDGSKYHELAERLGLDERIVWRTEFVPDDMVKYYFCAADLVTQTYKSATQSGITQIAYHFEKPMLVTRVGGLSEVVPDGRAGYCVEPSVEAIADVLADFAETPKDFTEGLKSEKAKYSWKAMSDAVLSQI